MPSIELSTSPRLVAALDTRAASGAKFLLSAGAVGTTQVWIDVLRTGQALIERLVDVSDWGGVTRNTIASGTLPTLAAGGSAYLLVNCADYDRVEIWVTGAGTGMMAYDAAALSAPEDGSVNVMDFGADPAGVNDSSAAFRAAVTALPARGGVVMVPAGVYVAQNIPIRDGVTFKGAGAFRATTGLGTEIQLPASPTANLFVWEGAVVTGEGGGFYDMSMVGGQDRLDATVQSSGKDGIDLSTASFMYNLYIERCLLSGFRRGISGPNDTVRVWMAGNTVEDCYVGYYAPTNHPYLHGLNLWRNNSYGFLGNYFDIQIQGQRFSRNRIGIASIDGTRPSAAQIQGNLFFCNYEYDVYLGGPNNSVSGNQFVMHEGFDVTAITTGASTVVTTSADHDLHVGQPVYFRGTTIVALDGVAGLVVDSITSNRIFTVAASSSGSYGGSGGKLWTGLYSVVMDTGGQSIDDNFWRMNVADTEDCKPGPLIYLENAAVTIESVRIDGNRWKLDGVAIKYIGGDGDIRSATIVNNQISTTGVFFDWPAAGGTRDCDQCIISQNDFGTSNSDMTGLAVVNIYRTSRGNIITNNVFRGATGVAGLYVFDVDLDDSVFTGNNMRVDASEGWGVNVRSVTAGTIGADTAAISTPSSDLAGIITDGGTPANRFNVFIGF